MYIYIYKRAKLTKKRGIKRDREDKGDKDALNSRIHARRTRERSDGQSGEREGVEQPLFRVLPFRGFSAVSVI